MILKTLVTARVGDHGPDHWELRDDRLRSLAQGLADRLQALRSQAPTPGDLDHLLASAIFDSENTSRLQENPDALEGYLQRARDLRQHMRVLGIDVAGVRDQAPEPGGDVVERDTDLTKAAPDASLCPFCDSDAVLNWFSHDAAPNTWAMFCETCGAEGPHCGDEQQSVKLWDRRAQEDRAYEAIRRLASMEAFAGARAIKVARDEELIARIDFAKSVLDARAALTALPVQPVGVDREEIARIIDPKAWLWLPLPRNANEGAASKAAFDEQDRHDLANMAKRRNAALAKADAIIQRLGGEL